MTVLIVASNTVSEDKLQAFYEELKRELTKVCSGSLKSLQDQTMCEDLLQRKIQPRLEQILDNYKTVIKGDKVKIAQGKIEESKQLMHQNVIQMSENVNTVKENLLPSSQQIAMEARTFEK